MLKRVLTGACVALLAAGCGSTRNDTTASTSGSTGTTSHPTTSTGSTTGNGTATATTGTTSTGTTTGTPTSTTTGTGTTTGNTTSGNTSTTGGACTQATIAQARNLPAYQPTCITGATVLFNQSAGGPDGGGTVYSGTYVVADSNGDAMQVYKTKYAAPTGDPIRGDNIDVSGIIKLFPTAPDGGALPQSNPQLGGSHIVITVDSNGNALPTPKTPTIAQLDHNPADTSMIGSWVQFPTGSWNLTYDPALQHTSSGGSTFQDGVALSDGTSTVWVDTYDLFTKPGGNKTCFPGDGGQPDLSAGGFKGYYDWGESPNGTLGAIFYFGDCSDAQ